MKIDNCPFCKSSKNDFHISFSGHRVRCLSCFALGPAADTQEKASELWNVALRSPIALECPVCHVLPKITQANGDYMAECPVCYHSESDENYSEDDVIAYWNNQVEDALADHSGYYLENWKVE